MPLASTIDLDQVQNKFNEARKSLTSSLIERDDEIDIVLTALVSQEHPLLVGSPGTAKSLLLDSVMDWMGAERFTILFNKFTVPEEVFGPLSINALKNDQFKRVTAGRLPTATGAFGDEIFKASSAILNTLLRILNERTYEGQKVPLKIFVAASNEWPSEDGGKELGALFDRFLFRKKVKPISTASGLKRLLWEDNLSPKFKQHLDPAELDAATNAAQSMPFSSAAESGFHDCINELRKEGIRPGDRRMRKSVRAVKAFAWINGATEAAPEHLDILSHTLWDDPAEQQEKCSQIVGRIANPQRQEVVAFMTQIDEIKAKLNRDDFAATAAAMAKLGAILKGVMKTNRDTPSVLGTKAEQFLKEQMQEIKAHTLSNL